MTLLLSILFLERECVTTKERDNKEIHSESKYLMDTFDIEFVFYGGYLF